MERVRFIEHDGERVLLIDFNGCDPEEVGRIADEVPDYVTPEPPNSVLLLADFTNCKISRDAVERIKIAAVIDRAHVKRSAWVFNGNIPKPLHDAVQTFSGRDIPKFETRDEAIRFLLGKS